jgi:hypothetical protein
MYSKHVLLIDLIPICFTGSLRPLSRPLLRRYRLCFVQFCVQDNNDLIPPAGDLLGLIDDGLNVAQALGVVPSGQSSTGTKRGRKSHSVLRTGLQ